MAKTYLLVIFLIFLVGLVWYFKFDNNNFKVSNKPAITATPTQVPSPTIASISATPKVSITASATRSGIFVPTKIPTIYPTK